MTAEQKKQDVQKFLISRKTTVRDAMKKMKEIGQKVIFVVNDDNTLFGSLSDGDIRKWIIQEGALNENIEKICNTSPHIVNEDYDISEVKALMIGLKIECVPVIDSGREIVSILTWDSVFAGEVPKQKEQLDIPVVIMAGGKGTRLDPFTRILPKPLIPIGDKPIIEMIVERFLEYGVNEFYLSINHKAKMIKSYFEEIEPAYQLRYIEEQNPLGTAGSLKLLKDKIKSPFIVTNCDIIVESDYSEIVKYHKDNNNDLTVVVSCRHYTIPYGVCEIRNGGILEEIKEKPKYDLLVNTGMYVLNSNLLELIPADQVYHITDLIKAAKAKGFKIGVFPIDEKSWIDIGQWEEYRKAVASLKID
ncbi:MAG: nucleotidyltransferase family protein [Candidatus Margulisiibacteriota bacterium]